jgi:hypothetical protein
MKETKRNNSTLSYIDCCMRLTGPLPFEDMSNDDLDSIYAVAFEHWAYHLTRQGYIDKLNKKREDLLQKAEDVFHNNILKS